MMIFSHILQTSYPAVLACLIVFISRIFVKKHGAAKWCVYLWMLLILSLLIPDLPKSNFSMYEVTDRLVTQIVHGSKELNSEAILPDISWLIGGVHNEQSLLVKSVFWIWAIGANLQALYYIIAWGHISYVDHQSEAIDQEVYQCIVSTIEQYGLTCSNLVINYSSNIQAPCLIGIKQPRVLLPNTYLNRMDSRALGHIVLHEYAHWQRKDHLLHGVTYGIRIFYWFHLPIRIGLSTMNDDMEVAADALACKWLGEKHLHTYAETLLNCAKSFKQGLTLPVLTFNKGKEPLLKRRLHYMLNKKEPILFVKIVLALILICTPFIILTTAEGINDPQNDYVQLDRVEKNLLEEWQWPLAEYYIITSDYGKKVHPVLKTEKMHTGIDIAAPIGTEIYAVNIGKVIYTGEQGGYGNIVIIQHSEDISSVYAHLDTINVKVDDDISSDHVIGTVGATGSVTAPNLHLEIRLIGEPVNPMDGYLVSPFE